VKAMSSSPILGSPWRARACARKQGHPGTAATSRRRSVRSAPAVRSPAGGWFRGSADGRGVPAGPGSGTGAPLSRHARPARPWVFQAPGVSARRFRPGCSASLQARSRCGCCPAGAGAVPDRSAACSWAARRPWGRRAGVGPACRVIPPPSSAARPVLLPAPGPDGPGAVPRACSSVDRPAAVEERRPRAARRAPRRRSP
jgi:hypothetical protein